MYRSAEWQERRRSVEAAEQKQTRPPAPVWNKAWWVSGRSAQTFLWCLKQQPQCLNSEHDANIAATSSYSLFFSLVFSIVVIKCSALRATELRSEAVSERQHKLLPHISMNINCLLSTYLIISFQFTQHWEQRWLFFLLFRLGEWQQTYASLN